MKEFRVLACVTVQRSCEKMIVEGAKLARDMGGELIVLHVAQAGQDMLGYAVEGDAMEYLYRISSEHDAEMSVLRATDIVDAITQFVKKKDITVVLTGAPNKRGGGRNISAELMTQLPGVMFQTLYSDE